MTCIIYFLHSKDNRLLYLNDQEHSIVTGATDWMASSTISPISFEYQIEHHRLRSHHGSIAH